MTVATFVDSKRVAVPDREPPSGRHLIHVSGCPLYVWWALGRCRNRAGEHWRCWFVYLEYRRADGKCAYVQQQLPLASSEDSDVWQQLTQVELESASIEASRSRLICG